MSDSNIHRIQFDNREIILIGTAHVSKQSVEEVKEVIETEQPETVCIELCESRFQTIMDNDKWKNTDLFSVIKQKKSSLLLISLVLSSYQKRLARQFGIEPGQEMIQGITSAKEIGATLCLADRNIQVTLQRLWRGMGLWGKVKLFFELFVSLFFNEEIKEEDLERMKSQDMLTSTLNELSHSFPQFKSVLIDERDQYLAQKIKEAPGKKVVAVLGAGHIPGIKAELLKEHDLEQLSKLVPPSKYTKIIGWSIPVLILALIVFTFSVNKTAGIDQVISWVFWSSSLAALGALISFAHPLSVLASLLIAPLSTLHPFLAAGWVAGLTETFLRKPSVQDFENIADDVCSLKGFWRNKVTHILLVVVLVNLGSGLGAIIGGTNVIRHFINALAIIFIK